MPTRSAQTDELQSLDKDGFKIVPDCLSPDVVQQIIAAIVARLQAATPEADSVRRRGEVYAVRNLVECVPEALDVLFQPRIRQLLNELLGPRVFLVRSILFDKTGAANWHVTWHQDLSIAVRQRAELPGYGAWSIKAGVHHVQPPIAVLARMLTLRLHLDACTAQDGAVRVVPGSHRHGRLSIEQIDERTDCQPIIDCHALPGTVMLMKPLLLHSSAAAHRATHRRVLHFELAADLLPVPLEWHGQRLDMAAGVACNPDSVE